MPTAAASPVAITIQHPDTLSAADILGAINSIVQTDAPVVISALPVSAATSSKISVYVALGELGLQIATQIAAVIHALHLAKTAPVGA